MQEKKVIKLDLTNCEYLGELHEKIRIAFDFPEWYGANWSAFWDLLWSECDADEVIIIGENTISADFKNELKIMHSVFDDLVDERKTDSEKYEDIKPFSYQVLDS